MLLYIFVAKRLGSCIFSYIVLIAAATIEKRINRVLQCLNTLKILGFSPASDRNIRNI